MLLDVRKLRWLTLAMALGVLTFSACQNDDADAPEPQTTADFSSEVVIKWNELILEVERFTPGYLPPVAARAYGYIGLAAYEAAVPGMPDHHSLGDYFAGLELPGKPAKTIHYPTALNAAYAAIIRDFFPTAPAAQQSAIIALQKEFNQKFEPEISPEIYSASIDWGTAVAEAVYAWSAQDPAGHEGYLHNTDPSYVPPSGPGLWQPTYPNFHEALLPHWGQARLFAASTDDKCDPPLVYSTDPGSEFYAQALETENKVNLIHQGLNYEDKWIAQFWSDDCAALTFSPGGHWIAIATQALENTHADLAKSVVVMAKLGMAISDAGIRCWSEKYRFNLLRPVQYIRDVMGHNSWNSIMCPDGQGHYYTPAFPTYPSGHGTFGAAAAEVLTEEFGHSFLMTDNCHKDRTEFIGTPRTFNSFYEMAGENAYSRIPIGVHFRMDAEAALDLGYAIGRKVNALPWKP